MLTPAKPCATNSRLAASRIAARLPRSLGRPGPACRFSGGRGPAASADLAFDRCDMGGLIVATVLTLLFLPALYAAWFKVKREEAVS